MAVFDFCRAVDDGVDELESARSDKGGRAAPDLWRSATPGGSSGGSPATPQGTRSSPSSAPSTCRARSSTRSSTASRWMPTQDVPTVCRPATYCHRVASSVGLICAEIFGQREPAVLDYARTSASPCSSPTSFAMSASTIGGGGSTCRWTISFGSGAPKRTFGREGDAAGRGLVAQGASRPRAPRESATVSFRAVSDAAHRLCGGNHAGDLPELLDRIEAAGFDVFSASFACRAARRRVSPSTVVRDLRSGADGPADVVVIGAGFAGLAAAVRLVSAGLVSWLSRSAAAGRPGDGVHRSGHRRARRQRPARAVRLLSRDVRLSRADRHRTITRRSRMRIAMTSGRRTAGWRYRRRRQPPWHLVDGVLRWRPCRCAIASRPRSASAAARQLAQARVGRRRALLGGPDRVRSGSSACGQSPRLLKWLWQPLALAALNQSPDMAAAAPFVRVLRGVLWPRCRLVDRPPNRPARRTLRGARAPMDRIARRIGAHSCSGADGGRRRSHDRVRCARRDAIRRRVPSSASVPWHAFARLWAPAASPMWRALADDARASAARRLSRSTCGLTVR